MDFKTVCQYSEHRGKPDMQKILIIDDDTELFGLLENYLQDEGFSCVHAPDAGTGLQKSAESHFGIIVLDIMLPGMNGFEVLRRLRNNDKTKAVPVLMLTARGEMDRIVGLEMGARRGNILNRYSTM